MTHATCTQWNQGDSWLLVVNSQIANLTPGLSFGHNLCFSCPNGSCEPTLNIYVPRAFQWYKSFLIHWILTLVIAFWKLEIHWDSNSQNGSSLGIVRVHSLTLFCTPRSMKCDSQTQSWPAPLQTLALVASPRLGLWHPSSPTSICLSFSLTYLFTWL
jgi:hypothetical protein